MTGKSLMKEPGKERTGGPEQKAVSSYSLALGDTHVVEVRHVSQAPGKTEMTLRVTSILDEAMCVYAFNQMGVSASYHLEVPDEYGQKPKAPSCSLASQAFQLHKGSPAL